MRSRARNVALPPNPSRRKTIAHLRAHYDAEMGKTAASRDLSQATCRGIGKLNVQLMNSGLDPQVRAPVPPVHDPVPDEVDYAGASAGMLLGGELGLGGAVEQLAAPHATVKAAAPWNVGAPMAGPAEEPAAKRPKGVPQVCAGCGRPRKDNPPHTKSGRSAWGKKCCKPCPCGKPRNAHRRPLPWACAGLPALAPGAALPPYVAPPDEALPGAAAPTV